MTTEEATRRSRADSGAAGSASVEFVLAAMVVLPMALAIVEFSQLAVARHALLDEVQQFQLLACQHGGAPLDSPLVLFC